MLIEIVILFHSLAWILEPKKNIFTMFRTDEQEVIYVIYLRLNQHIRNNSKR